VSPVPLVEQHGSGGLQAAAKKQGLENLSYRRSAAGKTGQTGSPLFAAVCSAKLHTVTGPVTWNKAYYVFELTSITPAKKHACFSSHQFSSAPSNSP